MRIQWKCPAVVLAATFLAACGGGGGEQTTQTPAAKAAAKAPAAKAGPGGYAVEAVAGGGSVAGAVKYQGDAPAAETIEISKDTGVCGTQKVLETVSVGAGGGLANAVVWIDGISKGKDWGALDGGTVDQHQCEYTPQVQIVKMGDELQILNSDEVLHNIHAYHNDTETLFNLAQPIKGMKTPKTLDRSGPVHLKCDVHSWMSAWVFVANHPYYAVTGADGSFNLGDVPAGTHKVKVWHQKLGEKSLDVTVEGGGSATADFTMP